MIEFDTDTQRAIDLDADFEFRTSVLLLPDDEVITGDYDASFSDIPAGRTLLELHLNFRNCANLRGMKDVERGLEASRLILKDWVTLGEWTAKRGYMPGDSAGFVGISPLLRPRILRQLGAKIDPKVAELTVENLDLITEQAKITTNRSRTKSPIRRFIISNRALVENLPVARAKLKKYDGWRREKA